MTSRSMWMVRGDVGGRLFEEFKSLGIVAIGWHNLNDLSVFKSRDDFVAAVAKANVALSRTQALVSGRQAYRFVREMAVGDRMVTYDPSERIYLVGTITTDYRYDSKRNEFRNVRGVKWDGEVPRDSLLVATRNSLGAISALFLVPSEASEDIELCLKGKASHERTLTADSEGEDSQVDAILRDIQNKAFEFIKDKVAKLDWEELQSLVAGVLRAMGYKTRISPPGADRGKDIVASPDGFGFESPRIVVEVKHRTGSAMGLTCPLPAVPI